MKLTRVAAYVRVSSASQDAAMQREAITRASEARGDRIPRALWFEETRSAKTNARPVLEQVRQLAREGRIARLYVWRLDRLTRAGIRDTIDLIEELRSHGCELVTLADGFDTRGPAAEIVLAVLAWAAKAELIAITERRAAARERVLASGGSWGRPRRLTRKQEAHARELASMGCSVRQISQAMKIPRATIGRCLKSCDPKPPFRTAKKSA